MKARKMYGPRDKRIYAKTANRTHKMNTRMSLRGQSKI